MGRRAQTYCKLLCLVLLASLGQAAVYNAPCEEDDQCWAMYTSKYECEEGRCARESLEYTSSETIGCVMIFFLTMVSNAAGIGGGAIMVPVFIYMFKFASIESIPLSKVTMLAGAIANFALTFNQRFPKDPNHLLIDFSTAAALTPLMLSGTQVGVLFQKLLPPAVVMTGLATLVIHSLFKMYKSGKKAFQEESVQIEQLRKAQEESKLKEALIKEEKEPIQDGGEIIRKEAFEVEQAVKEPQNLLTIWELYQPHWANLLLLCVSISIVVLTALMRGSDASHSIIGVKSCSGASTAIMILSQLLNCLLAWYCYKYNAARGLFNSEIKKVSDNLVVVLLYSYGAGIAAGLFGLGGGMVLGVYMISIGICPEFTTALTGFTLFWVATSTSTQYTIIGALHYKHASVFMMISLAGSFIGNLILRAAIRKFNRPSILIWTIFAIMAIAGTIIPYDVVTRSIKNPHYAFSFGSYC